MAPVDVELGAGEDEHALPPAGGPEAGVVRIAVVGQDDEIEALARRPGRDLVDRRVPVGKYRMDVIDALKLAQDAAPGPGPPPRAAPSGFP